MKLLLDENLPKRLKQDFYGHEVYAVRDKGWNGKKNGELLDLMIQDNFDAFLTFDKNLQFQQNFSKYKLPVIVLNADDNSYQTLTHLSPKVVSLLSSGNFKTGPNEIK